MLNNHTVGMPLRTVWQNNQVKQILFILTGVVLLAFASQLSIPFKPVPLTFQSTTVIFIGMTYGARRGTYVVALYLLAGALGLPIFADYSAGLQEFFGPTGGYLAGFLPAAFLSGYLAQRGWAKNILTSFLTSFLGISVIFTLGVLNLAHLIGFEKAVAFGLLPFIFTELVKIIILAFFISKLQNKLNAN